MSLETRPRTWLVGIMAAALVLRLAVVLLFPETIISLGNREKNDVYARSFVETGVFGELVGRFAGQPTSATRPTYAWFLIDVYAVLGRGAYTIGLVQACVSAFNALLAYLIARRLVGPRPALLAGAMMAIYPYPIWHDVHVVRTGIDAFFSLSSVLFLLELARTRRLVFAAAAGACMVAAAHSTNMLVPFIPVAALWLVFYWRSIRQAIPAALVLALAAGATLAPWVARNYAIHGRATLFSTDNGLAFVKNNNPHIAGLIRQNIGPDPVGQLIFTPEDLRMSEVEADAVFWRRGMDWMLRNPDQKLALMWLNVVNYWDPLGIRPKSNTFFEGNESVWDAKTWLYRLSFGPILFLGLFGMLRRAPIDRGAWLVILLFAFNTLLYSSTYASTRYRIPLDGLFAAYAAEVLLVAACWWVRRRAVMA